MLLVVGGIKMLVELFVFFQIVGIGLFTAAFFTKQEILWAITLVVSALLMFTSFDVEYFVYEWNATIGAYYPVAISYSYPYLMALNMVFFVLAMILGLFDLFDKYGAKLAGKN